MAAPQLDQTTIRQAACEATYLLNEAIRDLVTPQHLALSIRVEASQPTSSAAVFAIRKVAMLTTVIGVCRVHEIRKHFLTPWLFSEGELQLLGLQTIEHYIHDWGSFQTVRSQWAAHATAKESTATSPGRLVEASALGRALERTGIGNEEKFLTLVRTELLPAVERVRDKLLETHPQARSFITDEYPQALLKGASEEEKRA